MAGISTPTPSLTLSPSLSASVTPTQTQTVSLTQSASATLTQSTTETETATTTPTATFSATATATLTRTLTQTLTQTKTLTQTLTQTFTQTVTGSVTPTSSASDTVTDTFSATETSVPTPTQTLTPSASGTASLTLPSLTLPTLTATLSAMARTRTPTLSLTLTHSLSESRSLSDTVTVTTITGATPTLSHTLTPTQTLTATATPSLTGTIFIPVDDDDDGLPAVWVVFIVVGCILCLVVCLQLLYRWYDKGARNRGEALYEVDLSERDMGIDLEDKPGRERRRAADGDKKIRGVPIRAVRQGSAADLLGITPNHRVVHVDGKFIKGREDFIDSYLNKDRVWMLLAHAPLSEETVAWVAAAVAIAATVVGRTHPSPITSIKKGEDNMTTPLVHSDYHAMHMGVPDSVAQQLSASSVMAAARMENREEDARDAILGTEETARKSFDSMSPQRGQRGLLELDQHVMFSHPGTADLGLENPLAAIPPHSDKRVDAFNPMLLVDYMHSSGSVGGVGAIGEQYLDTMVYCPSRGVCAVPFLKVTASMPPSSRQVILTPSELRVEHNSSAKVDVAVPLEHVQDVLHSDDGLVGIVVPRQPHDLCMQFTPAYSRTFLVALGNAYMARTGVSITARRFTTAQLISKPISTLLRLEVVDF
eukprot:TRINITY_DN16459_c0_g1_i2.p1 TRINITY_DN16459_c0_g1~~TRINITY_DN16459_c0_g1_i2.p1  ORF type:complete len:651 (+),score=124.39 TRINITY_DN16459_c0_g1_i2:116-2068(+)